MLSLHAAAAMMGARLVGDGARRFARVNTDTRSLAAGELFVAIAGERFDGHSFIARALELGAAGVIAEHLPEGCTGPALLVADTRRALGELAAGWRRRFGLPTIAVTGSNGKTTVKEMIASILAARFGESARLATQGNLNNDIGVPLTTLRLASSHQAAVIELGMNHPGEIIELARIAQPTVALINNAQREHQEFMASIDAVAQENGSVLTALAHDGVAVFPAGTVYDALWSDLAGGRRCLRFGLDGAGDVRGTVQASTEGTRLRIEGAVRIDEVVLATFGVHNARNALAAAACAHAAGVDEASIAHGLARFTPVKGRLQRKRAVSGALVIDDTYNANPDSVRAAIDVLAAQPAPRWLVLGDMGEVGDHGAEYHAEIGAYAKAQGIERLYCMGSAMRDAALAYGPGALHFDAIEPLIDAVRMAPPEVSLLVKGSRFMRMERVVGALIGEPVEPHGASPEKKPVAPEGAGAREGHDHVA